MFTAVETIASLLRWVAFPLSAYVLAVRLSGRKVGAAIAAASLVCTTIVSAGLLAAAVTSSHYPQRWDFACFWLYGHAALGHHGVYDPATYRALATPIAVDAEFVREVDDVGFPYPPASILIFAPLGLFHDVRIASSLWLAALGLAFGAAIAALARSSAVRPDRALAAGVAGIAVALPASYENVVYQQTNFVALLLVVLAFRYRRTFGGGVAVGLAVAVKPYLAMIVLWFCLRRRWNAAIASVLTIAATTVAAIPLLGSGAVLDYVLHNPGRREPASVFAESQTATLYAALLRLAHGHRGTFGLSPDVAYVLLAVAAFAIVCVCIAKASPDVDDLSFSAAIALALVVYPATTTMYAVVLVPTLVAFARRARDVRSAMLLAAAAGAFFVANLLGGATTFVAFVAVFVASLVGLYAPPPRGVAIAFPVEP